MKKVILLIIYAVLFSCGSDFENFEMISKLRVIGVKADKPEINAGDIVTLEALAVNPADTETAITYTWSASAGTITGSENTASLVTDSTLTENIIVTLVVAQAASTITVYKDIYLSADDILNTNPDITAITIDDANPETEELTISVNEEYTIKMIIDEQTVEDSDSFLYQWFVTYGEFSDTNDLSDKWTAPEEAKDVTFYAVAMDASGGNDWYSLTVSVTD
ncbi:MAG: hypothetical protein ABIA04_06005 [Pseudomonadota bacterium]